MGICFFVSPIETVMWNEIYWENLDYEKAKEFIKKNPMPKNSIYESEEELLDDIKCASGVIAFTIESFNDEKNEKFFEWFVELVYECLGW